MNGNEVFPSFRFACARPRITTCSVYDCKGNRFLESWLKSTGLSEKFASILCCFCLCFRFCCRFLNFKSSLRKLLEKVSAPRKHAEWRYKIFSSCSCCQGGSLICCTHHCNHVTPSYCRSGRRDGCVHGLNSETIISVVADLGQCRWNEMFQC